MTNATADPAEPKVHRLEYRSSSPTKPVFRCVCGEVFSSEDAYEAHHKESYRRRRREPPVDLSEYGYAHDCSSEQDRAWFDEHVGENWRVRRAIPLEFTLRPGAKLRRKLGATLAREQYAGMVVGVYQVKPGHRFKFQLPIILRPDLDELPLPIDPMLRKMLDELLRSKLRSNSAVAATLGVLS